jgi:hypothetical protein
VDNANRITKASSSQAHLSPVTGMTLLCFDFDDSITYFQYCHRPSLNRWFGDQICWFPFPKLNFDLHLAPPFLRLLNYSRIVTGTFVGQLPKLCRNGQNRVRQSSYRMLLFLMTTIAEFRPLIGPAEFECELQTC